MNPADQAMVQRYLEATLAKVATIKKNLTATKTSLEQQERALYAATETERQPPPSIAPARSPSILDGDADMTPLNNALKKLAGDCNCPNTQRTNFLPPMPEGQ